MARSIKAIEEELLAYKKSPHELDMLDSTSKASIWRCFVFVVATAFWSMEKKWDTLTSKINFMIKACKPMSLLLVSRGSVALSLRLQLRSLGSIR